MSWRVRHEGSPRSVEGLSFPQVVEGLQDGLWEPTDEVLGPHDRAWVALEDHPSLADLVADLEPPPRKPEEATSLDMNPLIDVCLVLLIFFILTTSYAALQKVLDAPGVSSKKMDGPPVKTKEEVREFTIQLELKLEGDRTVLRVEDKPVELANLVPELARWKRELQKTDLMVYADDGVSYGTWTAVQDAAKGAGIRHIYFPAREKK